MVVPLRLFVIRGGSVADWPFILSSWLHNYKFSNSSLKSMANRTYYKERHSIVEGILLRGARVSIATPAEDKAVILGYAVSEPWALHYVYVKPSFRRIGIATVLLEVAHDATQYSHLTDSPGAHALLNKHPKMMYNPRAATGDGANGDSEEAARN